MKIRSVGAELFHAEGQIDTTKLTVVFRNFANAPKNAYVNIGIVGLKHVKFMFKDPNLKSHILLQAKFQPSKQRGYSNTNL